MGQPCGPAALLLTQIKIKKQPETNLSLLGIYAADGKGLDIEFKSHLLHYIYSALIKVIGQTDWSLKLTPSQNIANSKNSH